MKNSTIYLYVGNHGKRKGIEDYIELFVNVLGKRGIVVEVSENLVPDAVNLIIDEFTNACKNKYISSFKSAHPRTRFVYVLTEFVSRKYGVESFNHFGGIMDSAYISVINVVARHKRYDFDRAELRDYLTAIMFLPLIVLSLASRCLSALWLSLAYRKWVNPLERLVKDKHRLLYFHLRYLGLKSYLKYSDAVILSHEGIEDGVRRSNLLISDQKNLGVIYPALNEKTIIEKIMCGKEPYIEITGSITPYRQEWTERINSLILFLGIARNFGYCKTFSFGDKADENRGAFSLHPPQTKNWPYSSPTRIYRALSVDFNLPVLTHYFGQNPIEDVCYVIKDNKFLEELHEMYVDRDKLIEFLAPRISAYNAIVRRRNDTLVENIKALLE